MSDTANVAGSDLPVDSEEALAAGWFDGEGEETTDVSFKDYDITASPNDFNISTLISFIDRGVFVIPGFQRNYVWDIKRASKLIESLLVGLPIPQLFLYEDARNSFLVVDGQQRLMSIYYFVKQRFPRKEKRPAIRRILSENRVLPLKVMADDAYFQKFNLNLKAQDGRESSPFHGKNYETLDDYKTTLDLRTIRNIVVKQNSPREDRDSSVFEIFSRLNTGGVNLRPQEIRASLYHSNFTETLAQVNVNPVWRGLVGLDDPDLHEKDTEVLLRAFALVARGETYTEPMSGFLNAFARQAKSFTQDELNFVLTLFGEFFKRAEGLTGADFEVSGTGRFNIAVFEAVFRATCTDAFQAKSASAVAEISAERLQALKHDEEFLNATRYGVGRTAFVRQRYARARAILLSS